MLTQFLPYFFIIIGVLSVTLFITFEGFFVLKKSSSQIYKEVDVRRNKGPYQNTGLYLINLERSKARYELILPLLKQMQFPLHRIEGVDGTLFSEETLAHYVDFECYKRFVGHIPKKGTIGCSLSHIKTWKTFLESDYEFALIFEDDVGFDPATLGQALNVLIKNAPLWDFVNIEVYHRGWPFTVKKLEHHVNLTLYFLQVTHAGCYFVNRKAASALLSKALPIKMPIDHYYSRSWELDGMRFMGVEPRIVKQTFGDSEIEITNRSRFGAASALELLHRGIFLTKNAVIRFFYVPYVYVKMLFIK